nr:unnamed protein product [Callosobruchus chinensis]
MVTKRIVLQTVSKIFDPLGFLSPFIVRAEIILQSVWKAKLQWDEPLPIELANEYRKWFLELPSLSDLTMPRNALMKDALKLSIGRRSLKFDELQTVLSEVEATVNSRPLTYVENDADNLVILTPSHFLIGTNECGFFMDFTDPEIKGNQILDIWKKRNAVSRSFWKRWFTDYLQQLRLFHSLKPVKSRSFQVGDVALLHDQNAPRLMWKMVRVTQVFHGRDGKIRACDVRTADGTILRRPIQLLYPLEITAAREDVDNSIKPATSPSSGQPVGRHHRGVNVREVTKK